MFENRPDPETAAREALRRAKLPEARYIFTSPPDEARLAQDVLASMQRLAQGAGLSPHDGRLIAVKDNIDEAGVVTTAGTSLLRDEPPALRDAAIIERLRRLGLIPFGRTNLSECAFSGLGLNPHYGTPPSACDPAARLVPGGSSSGSAVAVARGIVDVALGSDTSGSARIPAAFNGIVGYRPSWKRYPDDGVYPLAPSLDTVGLLTASMRACVELDALLIGTDPPEKASPCLLVKPANRVLDTLETPVAEAFDAALNKLINAGFTVEKRQIAAFDTMSEAMEQHGAYVTAEAARELLPMIAHGEGQVDRRVWTRLHLGLGQSDEAYAALKAARARARDQLADELGAGCLVFPTVATLPPPIEALEADDDAFVAANRLALRNTMLGSLLDTPAITLPAAGTARPIGFQLSMITGRDRELQSIALTAETILAG